MSMKELAELAGTTSITISNRLKQINIAGEGVDYVKKGTHYGQTKFTDEFLINLVNENPNMSMRKLAKHANTSYKTISKRLKEINSGEQRVNYIAKDFKNVTKKFTDEYLINLIKENPEINTYELSKLVNVAQRTIYLRLKEINSTRPSEDKIVLKKNTTRTQRKTRKSITDDYLIKIINENPELDAYKLAKIADVSPSSIYKMLYKINTGGQRVDYIKKGRRNGVKKFSDELLINLVNENPDLNMAELAKITNTTVVTIKSRLNQINIDGKGVNYVKKDFKHLGKKFTDEFLINLVNENPELSTSELAKLSGTSQSTISRRLKEIRCNTDQSLNYITKKFNNRKKFTDEFLINLVNENPDLNMAELAKLANSSPSTISRRLDEINSNGERVKYSYKI
ncbi:hypothetical protein CONCODRAFT_79309 [Conidiobolus coronatus NRRL 28638]|uniref:M protein trans-acting positive regulator (MGA) HTH domain-containing protein n=1 Tax=Conidiobolus coronatus (strain ATCC 28846 / CBS 209.66 / NRRL 28638) TaxID=796925 RepID=A0A137P3G3_CONC2|nr:hypothetical protein CONCODRAFT_79309 [Conidiobolus coronatus NRRL 28638]|eukprot:KXN69451.1 hypothetical protein CONCODRAFT_79309 [Conidiobolus coronatus NRRL 28638]